MRRDDRIGKVEESRAIAVHADEDAAEAERFLRIIVRDEENEG